MIFDGPACYDFEVPEEVALRLDPFTTILRSTRTGIGEQVYHLDPACPLVTRKGVKMSKGRLGAMVAAGRRLCALEASR